VLSERENALLTRVGQGTPMGELYRRFWLPVLRADELPEPDCTPVRLTVLGEDLVAFKDSTGRVGVLDERCPHRLASLFWGRNEDGGLRCVYHGWKWDVEGNCLDVPNAPEGESYKDKIHAYAAYPAVERGGLIWAYMGPKESVPPVPDFELNAVPASHRYISKMFIGGNWMQGLEGDIDSSHVSFLHSRLDTGSRDVLTAMNRAQGAMYVDKTPRWDLKETDYGIMLAAQRNGEGDTYYWRVNQWSMPSFTMIAARPGTPIHFQVRVPVDDEHQIYYRIIWHPTRALTEEELRDARESGVNFPEIIPGTFQPRENRSNNYLIDREAQRTSSFTGIKSIPAQDWAVQEHQGGPILDRSLEHLVSADSAIIAVRGRLLKALREFQEGTEPDEPNVLASRRVRPIDIILHRGLEVWEGAKEYLEARAW
jgi:phenylpropionate dioxygenase-like ring-hydroxylating dioxygenase large terminal subunit